MLKLSFEEVVQAAHQLNASQKAALLYSLHHDLAASDQQPLTREQVIADFEALRASGAFDRAQSLRGKYARPDLDISAEALNTYLHTQRCYRMGTGT